MDNQWDSKPSKVQTFFQLSITALAFLAFAGYLLCMIVQAIKSKGKVFTFPNPTVVIQNSLHLSRNYVLVSQCDEPYKWNKHYEQLGKYWSSATNSKTKTAR